MAKSMYNEELFAKKALLKQWVKGEVAEVDLSGFLTISKANAKEGKVLKRWANWADTGVVSTLEDGTAIVIKSINAHTIAIGDVLGALGYRGSFSITNALKLVRAMPTEAKKKYVTVDDIVAD